MSFNMAYIHELDRQDNAPTVIQTTLYELVEAVNEAAGPEKEDWVPLIVARMLKTKKN